MSTLLSYVVFFCSFIILFQICNGTVERSYGHIHGPPDIFFLGVAKAGTTALHAFLSSQGMCGGRLKEYHYWGFHHDGEHSYKEYAKNFAECPPGNLTIDGSPSNAGFLARENILHAFTKESFASKKFIFILREPIDRMLSWYNFERAKGLEPCDEKENENCELYKKQYNHMDSFKEYYEYNTYISSNKGAYMNNLQKLLYDFSKSAKRYWEYPLIPRQQMFIVNYDTMKYNTSDTLMRLTKFLGVSATSFELPYVNDLQSQLNSFGLKQIKMKCSDYLDYKPIFEVRNAGLIDFINNDANKPPEEPHFPEFIDKYAEQCKDYRQGDKEED